MVQILVAHTRNVRGHAMKRLQQSSEYQILQGWMALKDTLSRKCTRWFLEVSASNGHLKAVKFVARHIPDTLNFIGGHNNQTALVGAVSKGHLEVARFLLEGGAEPNLGDKYGRQTPLELATLRGNLKLLNCSLIARLHLSLVGRSLQTSHWTATIC